MSTPKQPSALALRIAKRLYPNGSPNCHYAYSDAAKNEEAKQLYRDFYAAEIDKELNQSTASQTISLIIEAAVDRSVGIQSLYEEMTVILHQGGHDSALIKDFQSQLIGFVKEFFCDGNGRVTEAALWAQQEKDL